MSWVWRSSSMSVEDGDALVGVEGAGGVGGEEALHGFLGGAVRDLRG